MATVELKSISELFGLQFFIPSYQRGYRWTTVQVRELLEDLYDFSDDNKREDDDYYCLQPVIVKGRGEQWELVDGQQRLTAIWLLSALYYCSNRDDEINLEHQKYELEYEGKPIFTELFSLISKYVQDDTMPALIKHLDAYKEKSIDSRNLIESIEYIAQFTRKNKRPKGVLAKIFEAINSIKIIWYVLDSDEDPIQTFTNINANKIELTNAELIKAVLLNSCEDNNQMQNMALQWEEIERGLNDDGLWNFIVSKRRNVFSTRIDYLFEIWCAKTGQVIQTVSDDKHAVFRLINGLLNGNDQKDSADIWKEIQTIYDTLLDWFNDYYYYHTIGLLIIINEKEKDIDIINDLYQIYSSSDKKAFKKEICSKIRNIYFGKTKTTPFEVFEVDQIKNDLGDITFHDDYVRSVLLLYNIAMLVNANNTYERFPFELYKDEIWDIEHINPQTPKEASDDEKRAWLNSYLGVLENGYENSQDPDLVNSIKKCLSSRLIDFENIAKRVQTVFELSDNDAITNLVLLDANTNRGYKNACFAEKRIKIIEVERSKNNDEKYIPIGTKWVFLKGFENAKQLIIWGAVDMQDYSNDMATSIYTLLGGEINGNE